MSGEYRINEDTDHIQESRKHFLSLLVVIVSIFAIIGIGYWFTNSRKDSLEQDTKSQIELRTQTKEVEAGGGGSFKAPSEKDFNNLPQAPQR